MNLKNCPKCSAEMRNVTSAETANRSFVQKAPFQPKVTIDRYVCLKCGFTEEWFDPSRLAEAKKLFG